MNCNHTNSGWMNGIARRKLDGVRQLAVSGLVWITLSGLLGGCSSGGSASSGGGNGGGPVPEVAFAINFANNTVLIFTVDPVTGVWLASGSAATGTGPLAEAVHPSGKFLYVANSTSNDISAYTIDPTTGALAPITGSPFAALSFPHALAIDSTGTFLYVSTDAPPAGPAVLTGFTINATTGALTPIVQTPMPSDTTTNGLTFAPTTPFLYAADVANDVMGFAANSASGVLTAVPGNPFTAGNTPSGIAAHPAGKFVYTANFGSNNVSGYSVDTATGRLTPVPGPPSVSGVMPQAAVVEPLGSFLYVVDGHDNDVSAYSIDATTGALSPVTNSPFRTGVGPGAMAVDATGNFLYVVNVGDNNISVFLIQNNGSLTAFGTMQGGAGGTSAIAFRKGHP